MTSIKNHTHTVGSLVVLSTLMVPAGVGSLVGVLAMISIGDGFGEQSGDVGDASHVGLRVGLVVEGDVEGLMDGDLYGA